MISKLEKAGLYMFHDFYNPLFLQTVNSMLLNDTRIEWGLMSYLNNPFIDDSETNTYDTPKTLPTHIEHVMTNLMKSISMRFKAKLTYYSINKYKDNQQSLFWHSDDDCIGDTTMFTLSIGGSRRLWFRDKDTQEESSLIMKHADLVIMNGDVQKHYEHCLKPDLDLPNETRFALVFRDGTDCSITKHNRSITQ